MAFSDQSDLLKLSTCISVLILFICLAKAKQIKENMTCTAAGRRRGSFALDLSDKAL
jgi:hypothetical protein